MNPNPEMLNGLPGVACTGLLGCVFVMSCFIIGVIGGQYSCRYFLSDSIASLIRFEQINNCFRKESPAVASPKFTLRRYSKYSS